MKTRLEQFLSDLGKCEGVTTVHGVPEFVSRGASLVFTPCMYDETLIDDALTAGKVERRKLVGYTNGERNPDIEIVAARKTNKDKL